MEATIEIKRYFDDEDIKDIVEDEIRGYVREMVREYFDFNNYRDFVAKVASDVFKDCMDELDGDMIHDIQEKVRASIKDIGVYNIIGTNYSWRKGVEEKTEAQKIIDEEAEKLRSEVSKMILKAVEKAVDGNVAEIISDAIYDILSKDSK